MRRGARRASAYRIRVVGSIAITLSYVAGGRFDGMLSAAQLPLGRRRRGAADRPRGRARSSSSSATRSTRPSSTSTPAIRVAAGARRGDRSARCARRPAAELGVSRAVDLSELVDWVSPSGSPALGRRRRRERRWPRARTERRPGARARRPIWSRRLHAASSRPSQLPGRGGDRPAGVGAVNLRLASREPSPSARARRRRRLALPGPLGAVAAPRRGRARRSRPGSLGFASRRVLGQYEVPLLGPSGPPRLLFVGANIDAAARPSSAPIRRRCAGSRCTRRRTRSSSPRPRGCATTSATSPERCSTEPPAAVPSAEISAPRRRGVRPAAAARRGLLRGDLARPARRRRAGATIDRCRRRWPRSRATPSTSWTPPATLGPASRELRARLDAAPREPRAASPADPRLLGFELKLRQYRGQALLRRGRRRGRDRRPQPRCWDAPRRSRTSRARAARALAPAAA